MKGFIEVNYKEIGKEKEKILVNINQIGYVFKDEKGNVHINTSTSSDCILSIDESYEQVIELIKKAKED